MGDALVVITDSNLPPQGVEEQILSAAGLRVRRAACRTGDDVVQAAEQADALIVQWAPIDDAVLAALPRCRFVSRLGIGCDMIDLAAATRRGVAVANTPDYCVEEVTIHTLALLLASVRGVRALDAAVRDGRWAVVADAPGAIRPSRTTVAVVGFGRIGSRTADAARALGFRVLVHDPFVGDDAIAQRGHDPVTLAQALTRADVVSLHVPLTDATQGMLGARELAQMRQGAYVVNTCRGGLIDEDALAAELHSGHLAGAALDVFATEPLPAKSPLRDAPNVILNPHAAWYSPAALDELPARAAQQVVDFLAGRPVSSIVNPGYADAVPALGASRD